MVWGLRVSDIYLSSLLFGIYFGYSYLRGPSAEDSAISKKKRQDMLRSMASNLEEKSLRKPYNTISKEEKWDTIPANTTSNWEQEFMAKFWTPPPLSSTEQFTLTCRAKFEQAEQSRRLEFANQFPEAPRNKTQESRRYSLELLYDVILAGKELRSIYEYFKSANIVTHGDTTRLAGILTAFHNTLYQVDKKWDSGPDVEDPPYFLKKPKVFYRNEIYGTSMFDIMTWARHQCAHYGGTTAFYEEPSDQEHRVVEAMAFVPEYLDFLDAEYQRRSDDYRAINGCKPEN